MLLRLCLLMVPMRKDLVMMTLSKSRSKSISFLSVPICSHFCAPAYNSTLSILISYSSHLLKSLLSFRSLSPPLSILPPQHSLLLLQVPLNIARCFIPILSHDRPTVGGQPDASLVLNTPLRFYYFLFTTVIQSFNKIFHFI